jgi:COP9 signalosome complex subunit 3
LRYADIYTTLPTTKLAADFGYTVPETEKYISDLIAERFLPAEIEAPTGDKSSIVRFTQPTSSLDVASEERLRDQLLSQSRRIQALDVYVAEADHRLAVTKEYADHVRRARKEKADREQHGQGENKQDVTDLMGVAHPSDEEEGMIVDQRGES